MNFTQFILILIARAKIVLVTLGLFLFVINAMLLLLTAWISRHFDLGFQVSGFWPAFWAGLLISLVSLILSIAVGEGEVRAER